MPVLFDAGVWATIKRCVAERADGTPAIYQKGDATGQLLRLLQCEQECERVIGLQIKPRLSALIFHNLKGDRGQHKHLVLSVKTQTQLSYLEIVLYQSGKVIRHISGRGR